MSSQKPNTPTDSEAHNGEAPDAWLKGALRHAPDAQTHAPAALTHNILRESRLALELERAEQAKAVIDEAPTVRSGNALMTLLRQWMRPSVAAGLTSVMVASVVGVLWWDKPLRENGEPAMAASAPEVLAEAPQADAAPAIALPELPSPAVPSPAVLSPAAPSPAAPAPAAAPLPAPSRKPDVPTADTRAASFAKTAPAVAATAPSARPDLSKNEAFRARAESAASSPSDKAATVQADAAVAPAVAAAAAAPAVVAAAAAPAVVVAAAPPPPPVAARAAAATNALAAPPSLPPTSPVMTPIATLLAALSAKPEAWRWQARGGELQAVTPALQNWLALLNRSAGSRWSQVTAPVALGLQQAAEFPVDAMSLSLRISAPSGVRTRIELTGTTVTLQSSETPAAVSVVELAPQAADALRKAWASGLR